MGHRPPFKNITLPSIQYTVWDREIGALWGAPISMFQSVPSIFFIVRSVLFQLKLSMFQLPSVTKLFFSSGFGEINKKQPSSLKKKKKKKKKTLFLKKKKKKKKKKS